MKKESVLIGIIGLFIGTIIGWTLANGLSKSLVKDSATSNQSLDVMDAHFIEQMIPHHEDAIDMAQLAQQKSNRPEIKQLSENIVSSQSNEINQMKEWYKKWFGRELPTDEQAMQHHGMGSTEQNTALEDSENFDREYIKEMITHHEMAVMMASMLKNGSIRPEMKQLADEIMTAQSAEIEQLKKWQQEWGI